jgi:L-fucose mutarotase
MPGGEIVGMGWRTPNGAKLPSSGTAHPILGPELLSALRCMGHGDEIALVDANFPASSLGVRVILLDGASVTRALDAVLSVMPLDDFVPETTWRMQVVDQTDQQAPKL